MKLQKTSYDVLVSKYLLKDKQGRAIETNPDQALDRVAKALSLVEEKDQDVWEKRFRDVLEYALPGGRILSNAGTEQYKPSTSTINCVVSGTIGDSMEDIFAILREAAITLKAGCGIGYNFGTLRPKGSLVMGAGAKTSGPLSFMDVYNAMCATVSSAGGRRGSASS